MSSMDPTFQSQDWVSQRQWRAQEMQQQSTQAISGTLTDIVGRMQQESQFKRVQADQQDRFEKEMVERGRQFDQGMTQQKVESDRNYGLDQQRTQANVMVAQAQEQAMQVQTQLAQQKTGLLQSLMSLRTQKLAIDSADEAIKQQRLQTEQMAVQLEDMKRKSGAGYEAAQNFNEFAVRYGPAFLAEAKMWPSKEGYTQATPEQERQLLAMASRAGKQTTSSVETTAKTVIDGVTSQLEQVDRDLRNIQGGVEKDPDGSKRAQLEDDRRRLMAMIASTTNIMAGELGIKTGSRSGAAAGALPVRKVDSNFVGPKTWDEVWGWNTSGGGR